MFCSLSSSWSPLPPSLLFCSRGLVCCLGFSVENWSEKEVWNQWCFVFCWESGNACLFACFVSVYVVCLFVDHFVFKENQSTGMIVEFRDLLSSRWLRVSERACAWKMLCFFLWFLVVWNISSFRVFLIARRRESEDSVRERVITLVVHLKKKTKKFQLCG
jgi:hypothetical protein